MRLLLVLACLMIPVGAMAQPASSTRALQDMGRWGQELVAAQQPVTQTYQQCAPSYERAIGLLKASGPVDEVAGRSMLGELQDCLRRTAAAAEVTRKALSDLRPLSPAAAQMFNVDTRSVVRQTIATVDSMVGYLRTTDEAMQAAIAGDPVRMAAKFAEARSRAGGAMDGQILMFETLQKGLPLATHKAMFDIRLSMTRSVREITVHDPNVQDATLAAQLRSQGGIARTAARKLRTNWAVESKDLRAAAARLDEPSRNAMVVALDSGFATIAEIGDRTAALLETVPDGPVSEADVQTIVHEIAALEIRLLAAIQSVASAATRVN